MNATVIPGDVTGPEAPEAATEPAGGEELLAGKFKSVEDLVSSYKALEAKLGGQGKEAPANENTEQAEDAETEDKQHKDDTADPYGPVVSGALEQAGLSADEVSQHFLTTGSLTDDHYAALEQAGFTRDVVDVYLAGVKAKTAEVEGVAEEDIKAIQQSVGGAGEYSKMIRWAAKNLTQEEQESFNAAVSTGNKDVATWAVQGLYARFVGKTGGSPKFVRGRPGDDGPVGFRSKDELITAMRDPRYGKDSAYTQEVEQRVARSSIFQRKG